MISAATHAYLVVRRHVDLGRTRSIDLLASLKPPPSVPSFRARRRARPQPKDHPPCPTSATPRSPPTRTEIPRPKRGEGQWALGYTEPLNKNEQSKKDDDPLNVRARIQHIYSKRGFASIDPADLRGRFRWLGLYTQRAPGFDGGKTAMLEEEELDDEFFMMRVRSDGQLLSPDAVRTLGTIGQEFARDTADVTDRENIQFHWIRIEDVPEIWERLEAVGLTPSRPAATRRGRSSAPPSPVSPPTRSSTARAALDEIKRRVHRQPGRTPTCRASSRPP